MLSLVKNMSDSMSKIDLCTTICDFQTLLIAWKKVLANGGGAGGDGISPEKFEFNLKSNLKMLSKQLEEGIFKDDSYKHYEIPKPNGGKRKLMVPCIADRVVHTAIAQTLSPILEPQFENCSFAYRPGRSVQQAVQAIEQWRDDGYIHVIDADITNYFSSIDHGILIDTLKKHVNGHSGIEFITELVASIIEHQGMELGTLGKGLAQGSPLSPLLANLYLDYLDEKIEMRGVRIIRFADDFIILCKNLKFKEKAYDQLQEVLSDLDLELHPQKTRLVDFDRGFEFLGYLFVRSLAMPKDKPEVIKGNSANRQPKNIMMHNSATHEEKIISETKGRTDYSKGDRILYVLEPDRRLHADRNNIEVLTSHGQLMLTININQIDRLEMGRNVQVDQSVIELCMAENTQLIFLDGWGQQLGRLISNEDTHASLQYAQANSCASVRFATSLARKCVEARIRNQRTQLFRLNRSQEIEVVEGVLKSMGRNLRKVQHVQSVDELRGLEGASGAMYWPAIGKLCKIVEQQPFKRTRPAKDELNAAINYLTFMLERDTRSAIRAAGLHVGFGFLHKPNDYSEAAVYDLMEPFRAPLTEGLPVYLFNARRLKPEMFSVSEKGAIWMNNAARKAVISGYEQFVARRINITGKKSKLSWRRMMWHQAVSLAKAYRQQKPELFIPYLMEA